MLKIIEVMMYDDFIKSKIIKHNDLVDNLKDCIKYLTDSNAESISFNIQKKIKFTDIDVLEVDKNDNYIYTYDIYTYNYKKQADIIDNIHFVASNKNIKMIFILGGVEYDNINTYIHALSSYHNLQLKFIFTEKPNIDDEICLYYENYLLNYFNLHKLRNCQIVQTNTNVYLYGLTGRIEECNDIRIKHNYENLTSRVY